MYKLYKYQLKENKKINNSLIQTVCNELNISNGILIMYRMSAVKTEQFIYAINGNYRIIIYKNGTYGTKIKFR